LSGKQNDDICSVASLVAVRDFREYNKEIVEPIVVLLFENERDVNAKHFALAKRCSNKTMAAAAP
jgi:hypothetical protein